MTLTFYVSSCAVVAGIADGAFPRSADKWDDGRPSTLMPRRGRRRGHYRRCRRSRLIRVGQIGSCTLCHQTGHYGRCRRCGTARRQDPLRGGPHHGRSVADQAILTAGTAGRQDHRTVTNLSDRRDETILTYTSCHTVTVATRYKTNGITIATAVVRMYTIVVAAAGAILLVVARWDDRDFTAHSVRRWLPMVVLLLLLEKLSCLK